MRVVMQCSGFRTGPRQKFEIPNAVRGMDAPVAWKINNLEPTVWKRRLGTLRAMTAASRAIAGPTFFGDKPCNNPRWSKH